MAGWHPIQDTTSLVSCATWDVLQAHPGPVLDTWSRKTDGRLNVTFMLHLLHLADTFVQSDIQVKQIPHYSHTTVMESRRHKYS